MNKKTAILLLLLTGLQGNATAQLPGFKAYTLQDGLIGNPVRKIFQDSNGFIWIGTWEGLSKYDGHRFTNFTKANGLSFDLVNDMFELPGGKLIVALNNATTHIITNDRVQGKAIENNFTIERFVQTANGEMLALTDGQGIVRLIDGKWQSVSTTIGLPEGSLLSIGDSLFLLSSPELGKLYLLNSKFEVIEKYQAPVSVYSLMKDSDNRIWAGCIDGLKQVFVNMKDRRIRLALPTGLFKNPFLQKVTIRCMLEDYQKNIWMGTRTGLVLVEKNGTIQKFTKADGLPDDHIYCLLQDKENNIWIGTAQGVARLANQARRKYWTTQNGLLNDVVSAIIKTTNGYLISGAGGIQAIRPGSNQLMSFKAPSQANYVAQKNGVSAFGIMFPKAYIGSIDLKNKIINDSIKYTLPGQGNFFTQALSNRGSTVVGTTRGLLILNNKKIYVDSIIPGLVTCLFIDDSFLWVGTRSRGLYLAKLEEDEDVNLAGQSRFSEMPDSMIRSVYKDSKGILWVGTRFNGVYKITQQKSKEYQVEQFDKQRGLISDWIQFITEDKKHNIWLGSPSGVDKLIEGKNGWRVFNFSRFNNLFGVVNTIFPGDDGNIWIGMNNGLASIPDAGYDTLLPLPVHITRIQAPIKKDSSFIPAEHPTLSLQYRDNAISFDFTSAGFINEKEMKYSYRLLGNADTSWTAAARQQSVSYASLQPGSYRFEVRNLGLNAEWGLSTSYVFVVMPPIWRTWWFILSVMGAFGLIVYLLYQYRIDQLKRVQQVRNSIATDLHDDIGSTLTNISILTELSKRNSKDPEKAEGYLDRIREEVDASGQALDDIIWSVNTKNDTVQETAARMRRYAAELFDARNIRYELKMDPSIADKKIMMEQRRDLFLIFKESLSNIHKHAAASSVVISLITERDHLILIISDDGKGFDTGQMTHRNGITNIKERVRRRNGAVTIQSGKGDGTTINVRIPLPGITQMGD